MAQLLTTAIDYTNGSPHIGHAYEKLLADALARYRRLRGEDVLFLTGVDQHGQKVQQSARKQGLEPSEYVEGITRKFLDLWEVLGIQYDRWAATTDPVHKNCVRGILQRLWEEGHFYKASQRGFYSVRQEQFVTDKERGPDGEFGEEWGEVVELDEENYYFRLAEHREWLLGLIDERESEGRPFVLPSYRGVELRNAVERLSGDLCISRPKSRLAWGIEFPFDPDYVTYVWFDALVNYLSFAGFDPSPGADNSECFSRWPALHVIGKDILVPPHGVYWPIMLKACGLPVEKMPTLLVHGWWNISGSKMSKSTGNIVDPAELVATYGLSATRYYLLADIATGRDADFSNERLVARYNSELANGLGNLLNRSLSMARRYREGRLRKISASPLAEAASTLCSAYAHSMDACEIHTAIDAIGQLVVRANAFVEESAPWKLAKDPGAADKLDEVLYSLAETLRILSVLLEPVLPVAAAEIRRQLAWGGDVVWTAATWGGLADGHQLGEPAPVFPRIE
ncbi:MAG: methionine--tRNA ligase [Terrimicrobiaceae bacterium]